MQECSSQNTYRFYQGKFRKKSVKLAAKTIWFKENDHLTSIWSLLDVKSKSKSIWETWESNFFVWVTNSRQSWFLVHLIIISMMKWRCCVWEDSLNSITWCRLSLSSWILSKEINIIKNDFFYHNDDNERNFSSLYCLL